jgi:hypothetical protein
MTKRENMGVAGYGRPVPAATTKHNILSNAPVYVQKTI